MNSAASTATRLALGERTRLSIGRTADNDLAIEHPLVSRRHAQLERAGRDWTVSDLGSTNGTFLNGTRLTGRVPLRPGDVVDLGGSRLVLLDAETLERRDYRGHTRVEAQGVAVAIGGRTLLDQVSLTLLPSELVGLMGPSGAGKTTLMTALNGYFPPSAGRVLWNGRDLYADFDAFRLGIGYVPQDDILHGELSVGEALYYTAKLRLPGDTSEEEIEERITRVLAQLRIGHIRNSPIGTPTRKVVSGGERKRVNLAMELLTDPPVLFLDEPTSGLSSEDALMVMEGLRELADDGRTILLTIHQPSREVFRLMDNLAVVAKDSQSKAPARLVYYGPAYPEAIRFFNPGAELPPEPAPEGVLRGLALRPAAEWVGRYDASPVKRRFVDDRADLGLVDRHEPARAAKAPSVLAQTWILLRRGFALKRRDLTNTGVLFLQAPIIAGLLALVFGSATRLPTDAPPMADWQRSAGASAAMLFLAVIAALWFGCSNAAREIVAEWAVFRRERMVGLQLTAYVGSKLLLLSLIGLGQCVLLLFILSVFTDLHAPLGALLPGLVLAALVGTTVGLAISALAPTSEVAISLVPIAILPLVMLGGMLRPVHDMDRFAQVVAQLMPSRWAFEEALTTEAEYHPRAPVPALAAGTPKPAGERPSPDVAESSFPRDDRSPPALPAGVLATQALVLIAATLAVLRSKDIHL